jgi:hypothetical protein
MTVLRVATNAAEVLINATPKLRVAAGAAEVLINVTPKARVATVAAEVLASVENVQTNFIGWGIPL